MTQETMEKATVTKEDVVQYTINILSGIQILAIQSDTIGTAIKSAVNNLIVLQEMMRDERAARKDGEASGTPSGQAEEDEPARAGDSGCSQTGESDDQEDGGEEPGEDKNGNAEV